MIHGRKLFNLISFHTTMQSILVKFVQKHFEIAYLKYFAFVLYIYIYIYIYANFIKHNRHFMSTYFLLDPFEFPYYFYPIECKCSIYTLYNKIREFERIQKKICRLAPHHENYTSSTNQTRGTPLEKQGRAHKRCTPVDPHVWMCKSRTTSTNLHTATM